MQIYIQQPISIYQLTYSSSILLLLKACFPSNLGSKMNLPEKQKKKRYIEKDITIHDLNIFKFKSLLIWLIRLSHLWS